MGKILFLTNIERNFYMMNRAKEKLVEQGILSKDCLCRQINEGTPWGVEWEKTLSKYDVVVVKWMGTGMDTPFLRKVAAYLERKKITSLLIMADGDGENKNYGFSQEEILFLKKYLFYGGLANYKNLWLWLDSHFCGSGDEFDEPNPQFWAGIYHPRAPKVYEDVESYYKNFCKKDRPTIGVTFYREDWIWEDLEYQGQLIREIEKQGMNVICVFTNGMPSTELGMLSLVDIFNKYFCRGGKPLVDVYINTMKFSLTVARSMTLDYLREWNVPVLQAYTVLAEYDEWKKNLEGMNAMEISISITLPEFDGALHSVPIAAKSRDIDGNLQYTPIFERINRLVSKAKKWTVLRRKPNSEKKIAIVFHNFPAKNSNIGSAVGLDTPESIRLVLASMQEHGYVVDSIPADGKAFMEELINNATNDRKYITEKQIANAQKMTSAEYKMFFNALPEQNKDQLVKDWGEAPGNIFVYDDNLLVPGTLKGNVFVTVQPPRGFGEDPDKILHSPFCAPTHHYLGYYHWVRDIWKADAVVHVGTHGSLEWLPGKNAGLDCTCYPDLALGDLPNIYPYLISIVGEGIQAKRRGASCLIGHLPAPMTHSGMYDELEELEKLLEEYAHFKTNKQESLDKIQALIIAKATEANLAAEVSPNQDFDDYTMQLHTYLTDIKNMQIHNGLHILGAPPAGEMQIEYLLALLRMDNGEVPSLTQTLSANYGFDYYELAENGGKLLEDGSMTYSALTDKIRQDGIAVLTELAKTGFTVWGIEPVMQLPLLANASENICEKIRKICNYVCTTLVPNLEKTVQESTNLLRALDGEYVEPGPAGAPTSGGADILPTGRNFYGVDPRNLPTPTAWELGVELSNQVINRFIEEEGHYPESVGIVLWSGANMRSHGQCLAEFMYLLGVRPIWQKSSRRVTGIEIISLEELKRPRVDVTARISGLFRDSMPGAIEWLDRAVRLVAEQDEPTDLNFVRKHFLEEAKELEEQGISHEEAWQEVGFRVFGDELGVYGAGVAALLETKNWENIGDIADVYVRWGGHAYGGKTRGKFMPERFRKRMGSLDITIKNEDNVETNMLSSDDYNAYHGGMIAAVRSIKGSAPRAYCGDTTDRSKVMLRSVQEETKRIFRGEAINPKFIEGMMKHGYKGAADLANYVAHSYQWDATSSVMEDWMYEKYAEKYAFDPKVQKWMKEMNPYALQRIAEVLLEAEQRGLWAAKPETKLQLQKIYLSIEGELEERGDA